MESVDVPTFQTSTSLGDSGIRREQVIVTSVPGQASTTLAVIAASQDITEEIKCNTDSPIVQSHFIV